MRASKVIARASAGGVIMAFLACHLMKTPFFQVEDPMLESKVSTSIVNAAIMAVSFEFAFETGKARHNLQMSTKTQIFMHYAVIELSYWAYHTAQHTIPLMWTATGHAVHHSVGKTVEMSPIDAWVLHPFDFLGWSACAILPNVFHATRLHAKQHTRLLTIMATILMLQHTPGWPGHPAHHSGSGKTSLLLGL